MTPTSTESAKPDQALTPAVTTTRDSHWYSLYPGTRFGLGLDLGAPSGVSLLGIFRPLKYLRVNAGFAYNAGFPYDVIGFGIRGGISLVPGHWTVTPSLNLDVGHFFSGDASNFASNPTPREKTLLQQASFTYVSPQLGLEFGSQRRFAFYIRGGLSYITGLSFAGKDVKAEVQSKLKPGSGTFVSVGDLNVTALIPCVSLGFNLFLY